MLKIRHTRLSNRHRLVALCLVLVLSPGCASYVEIDVDTAFDPRTHAPAARAGLREGQSIELHTWAGEFFRGQVARVTPDSLQVQKKRYWHFTPKSEAETRKTIYARDEIQSLLLLDSTAPAVISSLSPRKLSAYVVDSEADDIVQLSVGAKIRVTVANRGNRLTGKLIALDDDTLTLQLTGLPDPQVLLRDDVTTVTVSLGRHSIGRGAGIGALVGLGVGFAIGLESGDELARDVAVITLTPIGALIGLVVPPGERWNEVQFDRIRVSAHPVRGRGLGVSLAFAF